MISESAAQTLTFQCRSPIPFSYAVSPNADTPDSMGKHTVWNLEQTQSHVHLPVEPYPIHIQLILYGLV